MSVEAQAGSVAAESRRLGTGRVSHEAWILVVCCVAQFMVILDLSIVNVALPSIQSSLGFSSPDLQWVVDAYSITFAGFLLLGGRAADHLGQRRMFVLALVLFAIASLAGGVAPDRGMLIGARAGQGLAGALMAASSLAIITASFPPGPKLHRAIGAWAAMNGLGGAAGVLFGGIITQELNWRWILLINPPIAVAAALVAYAVVSDRRKAADGSSFDVAGALTLTVGQMVLVYGVVEAGLFGWGSSTALVPMLLGAALLVAFGVIETRLASAPLVPFKDLTKSLQISNNIVLVFSASLFPMWFVSSLYLQQVLGLSPLDTGLIFLPMTLMIMLVASQTGKLVGLFGVRPVLGSGLVMLTTGMLLLARIGSNGSGVVYVMVPGLLTAAGIAMSIVPSTIAATQGAKEGQAGLASGLVNTSRQVGGGLGLAVLITLATQRSSHLIGTGVQVPQALTEGFRLAYLICGGLAATAAIVALTALPRTTAALGPSTRRLAAAIGVVVAGFVAADLAFANSHAAPVGAYVTAGSYSFVSEPSLRPPMLSADQPASAGQLAPGYIFTASFYDLSYPPMVGQSGPLILDDSLQPVWFKPVPKKVVASNLSLQTYAGKPALAWWQGVVTNTGATESGEDIVVNQHYQTVATLHGRDGWVLTLHAFVISGDDAWVTANKDVPRNLSKYGGAYNGALIDSAVQEYNLKTGKLLRNWDALDHINPSYSYATLPTNGFPWDTYHVNAIAADRRRHLPRLDARHLGRLPGQHQDGRDRVDPRWQAFQLRVRPKRCLPVAARRRAAAQRGGDDVRRPLLPAHRRRHLCPCDRAFPRTRAQARPARAHGNARGPVREQAQPQRRLHGRHAAAAEWQRVRRLGIRAVPLGVQPVGQAAAGRLFPRLGPQLPGDGRAVGRPAALPAGGGRPPSERHDDRVRELERRNRGRQVANPGRPQPGPTERRHNRPQVRVRDGDPAATRLPELRGRGARRQRPRDRHLQAVRLDVGGAARPVASAPCRGFTPVNRLLIESNMISGLRNLQGLAVSPCP